MGQPHGAWLNDTQGHWITKRIALQGIEPQTIQTYTMRSKPLSYKAIMCSIHTIATHPHAQAVNYRNTKHTPQCLIEAKN